MKRFLLIYILFCVAKAFGEPPSRDEVERLLIAMRLSSGAELIKAAAKPAVTMVITDFIASRKLSEEQKMRLQDAQPRLVIELEEKYDWSVLKDLYIDAYTSAYTKEEVNAALAFFESPMGKTYTEKLTPTLLRINASMSARTRNEIMPELGRKIEEIVAGSSK